MDADRDLSDLGVRYAGDPDADPVDYTPLLAPDPGPTPPATPATRRAARALVARERGWGPQVAAPETACQCGALAGEWCSRAGRTIWGFVHPSRGATLVG